MKRHDFDPISFVFGAIFVAVSAMVAYGNFVLTTERLRWLGAAFLLALGVGLLVTSTRQARDREEQE